MQTGDLNCDAYSGTANHRTDPEVVQSIGVYKSVDGGATWVKLDVPGDPYTWLLGTDGQGALYAWVWSQAAFARSQDGGATWNLLPTAGLRPNAPIKTLAIDPQDANHQHLKGQRGHREEVERHNCFSIGLMRLLEVLLHGGSQLAGWRTAQIHQAIYAGFGLSAESYTLTQLP